MEGRLLLDVVVGKGAVILKLLSSEDQTLLVWGDPFLLLYVHQKNKNKITLAYYTLLI
jgi:hypothetical protein